MAPGSVDPGLLCLRTEVMVQDMMRRKALDERPVAERGKLWAVVQKLPRDGASVLVALRGADNRDEAFHILFSFLKVGQSVAFAFPVPVVELDLVEEL